MIRSRAFPAIAVPALALLAQLVLGGPALPQPVEDGAAEKAVPVASRPRELRPRPVKPTPRSPSPPQEVEKPGPLALGPNLEQLPAFLLRRASHASPSAPSEAPAPPPPPPPPQVLRPVGLPDPSGGALAQAWCSNVVDQAQEARAAWQARKIGELEKRLETQMARLEAKRKEYVEWFQKQEEQRRKAEDSVVSIVFRMRPDAAAAQLAVMDEESAASILSRMNPRTSSVILNEMTPAKAARIAGIITTTTQARARSATQGARP